MAKKTPTNYGQNGIIEEIGFFRGVDLTAEEFDKFKKELIDSICNYIRNMEDGEEATLLEIAGKVCSENVGRIEPLLMDVYFNVTDALEEEIFLDNSKYAEMLMGMPYSIPFVVRKKQRASIKDGIIVEGSDFIGGGIK